MTLRVRPFEILIDDEFGIESLHCAGSIKDDMYMLMVGQAVYRLPLVSTGRDDSGPFATLEPYTKSLGSGLELTVEAEPLDPEPGSPLCCRIALTTRRDPAINKQLARNRGIDPDSLNVLEPPEYAVTFRFHQSGQCRGWAHLRRSDERSRSSKGDLS